MSASMIAAIGKNSELGKDNDLIWHFKEDMAFFKKVTTGHTVIMGRKTFESLPKALPNRRNIVISSNHDYVAESAEVITSIDEAIELCKNDEIFIIGGGKIYELMLPYADKLYLTEIEDTCEDADTYFPEFNKDLYNREVLASYEVNDTKFSHVLYSR